MAKHVAAIHVLKAQLHLADDDYRTLLADITRTAGGVAKTSCTTMSEAEQLLVRTHMERLLAKHRGAAGIGTPAPRRRMTREQFERARKAATPKERKVWALWHQLGRDGLVANTGPQALNAWIERQVAVSALAFCNDAQLDNLIEALKAWHERRTA